MAKRNFYGRLNFVKGISVKFFVQSCVRIKLQYACSHEKLSIIRNATKQNFARCFHGIKCIVSIEKVKHRIPEGILERHARNYIYKTQDYIRKYISTSNSQQTKSENLI